MPELQVLYSPEEIRETVARLGREIGKDYKDKNPLLIGVLKGSFVFMADLIRNLAMPLEVEFVALSSYGRGRKESSGKVKIVQGLRTPMAGRHVLVIEDVVDTGLTLSFFLDYLRRKKPASLKVCALFDKPSCHKVPITIDYLGLSVPDVFVVGYGIDYDERFRYLPGLCFLSDETKPTTEFEERS